MKGKLIPVALFLLAMLFSSAMAKDLSLPKELDCKAHIKTSTKDGLWEKTLIIIFNEERRVFSTNDGFSNAKVVINHAAHPEIWKKVCDELKTKDEPGGMVYIRQIKKQIAHELNISPDKLVQLATAADMDNHALVTKEYPPYLVTAIVTAGARTNAIRTGVDEGPYVESVEEKQGTVNIILLTNAILTDGAMARAVITATEAKTAAFQELNVPSSYTQNAQATGTGTDNVIIVSGTKGPKVKYTGGHSKMGELIGKAVFEAVALGLERQNGFRRQK